MPKLKAIGVKGIFLPGHADAGDHRLHQGQRSRPRRPDASRMPISTVPHTLLLADDSVTIQRVIELTFADEDVHVVAVSDGDQAIAALDADAARHRPGRRRHAGAERLRGRQPRHGARRRWRTSRSLLLTGAFEPVDQATRDGCRLRRRAGQAVRAAGRHRARAGAARRPTRRSRRGASRVVAGGRRLIGSPAGGRCAPPPSGAATSRSTTSTSWTRAVADARRRIRGRRESPSDGRVADRPIADRDPSTPSTPRTCRRRRADGARLADAFAALLAAEQSGTRADRGTGRPIRRRVAAATADRRRDRTRSSRRVLERLSDGVVRDAVVADLVSRRSPSGSCAKRSSGSSSQYHDTIVGCPVRRRR